MSNLMNFTMTFIVFGILAVMLGGFYSDALESNSKNPVFINSSIYERTEFYKDITTDAVNQTKNTEQPSAGEPLDFFFSLPALFLQATTQIVFLVYETPAFIGLAMNEIETSTGLPLGLLTAVLIPLLFVFLLFRVLQFMRGGKA